jgi:hypothetical protein
MFSFGFQKAFERGFEADDEVFFTKVRIIIHRVIFGENLTGPGIRQSLESAKAVVTVLIDSLVPTGYIRFAPDGG